MTESEKEIVRFIQDDMPLVTKPLTELAGKLKLSEKEIVARMKN